MYKYFFLVLLFSGVSNLVFGQNLAKAYVIDLKGDTLTGKVFLPDDQENYLRINFFKRGILENAKQYHPGNISEYGYDYEQVFRSFKLSDDIAITEKRYVFLKVLIDQPDLYSLYVFRNKLGESFYFIKGQGYNLTLLTLGSYKMFIRGLSGDCEKITDQNIDDLDYATSDLAKTVNILNSCLDDNYEIDKSYLSDGIRNYGIRIGTGFGLIPSSQYSIDSPDFLAAINVEYSRSQINSIIFELGFSRRTLTYTYYQQGFVSTFFPTQGRSSLLRTSTIANLNMLYGSLGFKKNLDRFYVILEGKFAINLNSSENYYSAITTDEDFRNQFDENLKVKQRIPTAYATPSVSIRGGNTISIFNKKIDFELGLSYLAVKSTRNQWFEKKEDIEEEFEIQCNCGPPYTLYRVSQPVMPKFTIDLSFNIPIFRN
ncbi:hypothetical protein [Gracilimonas tropica]|uniref:hypothetical protein n=1 Tax=Gracilimonas tropica TaxID=454600 RepID=UPI000364B2B4|nr:hypothetical protein [Gracilimonas tropica]